jgi:hypothetical protein
MLTLRKMDLRAVAVVALLSVLAGVLLTGVGRAQEQPQPAAPGGARYEMAMAGTRACWVIDTSTGELFKCITDSGYDPKNSKWYTCGKPEDATNYLKIAH